jgi:hypothetical protein
VPLWREKRGVSKLWDPATDRLYNVDGLLSAAWRDIHDAVKATMTRRMDRLAQSIREMAGGSVAQEWVGWDGPYQSEKSHFNIIGASVTVRSLLDAVDGVSRPLSSSLATAEKPRVVATNLTFDLEADRLPSPAQVAGELMTMGVSECYFSSSTEEGIAAVGAAARASTGSPVSDPMKPLYFPLAAWYPCAPGRVAPGVFWLPRKEQGQTLNFGAGLMGYRYIGLSENFIAVWSTVGEQRVKMKMSNPKTLEVRALGIQNPNIRRRRDDFDITLTATPILFMSPQDVPAPVQSWEETSAKVDTLLNGYAGLVQPFGSEQLDFITAVKNWNISPGSSLISMMTMLEEMAVKAAPFMWVEAEKVRKNTFSGVVERAGATGGRTLALTTLLSPPEGGYQLEFQFTPRVPGPSEIWVSGRIPSGSRNNIVVTCAAQSLRSSDQPRSPYGDELAWYKLGDVELPEGEHLLTLNCDAETGARIELDTIVIAPKGWAPTGGIVPKDWLKPTKEPLSTD